MKRRHAAATLLLVAAGNALAAQPSQSVMELNRSGKWNEAAAAAARVLADTSGAIISRCETRAQLTYALGRLRRDDEARDQGAIFGRECATLPSNHWARSEVAKALAALNTAPSTTTKPAARSAAAPGARVSRDDDWPIGNPFSLGLDTAVLRAHRELCARSAADACVVVRRGQLVDEWYGPNYAEPIGAMSSTKSVTGLLAGLLIADGRMSIDDPVSRFIPEWRAGADAGVTVRHLLTMTSGLPDDRTRGDDVGSVSDKETFAFGRPLGARPGEAWAYTNNGVFLLSPLLDRAAAEPIEDYAARRLFAPLGMRRTRMHIYPDGQAWTHADLETTPRDLARIGQLMLDGGMWRGQRVLTEQWVRESTRKSQPFADYGLLWWLDVPNGFAARGYLDTNLYVFPATGLVVVRMQAKPVAGAAMYEREAQRLFERMVR